jgi:aminomethyltransferase
MTDAAPKKTPLYDRHVAAGAKMVPFAGFSMPLQYTGVLDEHRAVREDVGLFDVSHMGEIVFEGEGAPEAVDRLVSNKVATLENGRACYTGMLTDRGTFVDDVICYRLSDEAVLVCVNAANREKDFAHVLAHHEGPVAVRDAGDEWAQIAVQGPRAVALVNGLAPGADLEAVKRFRFVETDVAGVNALVARTGYTGEDGFEIFCASGDAGRLWDALVAAGGKPCGLGARDTLRLEAALALYGNDIDEDHTPLEAGLAWTVKLDKDAFVGKDALLRQKESGVPRRLVGFELVGRGVPRAGMPVLGDGGEAVGTVTSGTMSPTLKRPIGMAYVTAGLAEPGTALSIDVRGKAVEARVVQTPFYKR